MRRGGPCRPARNGCGVSFLLDNWIENLSASPVKSVALFLTVAALFVTGFLLFRSQRDYGTVRYASAAVKWGVGLAVVSLLAQAVWLSRPYEPPPTGEIAVVLGNTQNTPNPQLRSDVSSLIEDTMLLHKGEAVDEFLDSISLVSAAGSSSVVPLDADDLGLVNMSINNTRAERDARNNVQAIERHVRGLKPAENGVDYLEAILLAKQNAGPDTNIVVVGSGLSDSGDLDFAHTQLLHEETIRAETVDKLVEKYGRSYLAERSVTFTGLGDTVPPQEPLAAKQKDVVRELYQEVITALGGSVSVDTKSQTGDAVKTDFTVSTTDTGCGDVNLRFDEQSVKFVSNEATFIEPKKARRALRRVAEIYEKNPTAVKVIEIDGYIAHVRANDPKLLSGDRARTVRDALESFGIPAQKLRARGKGYGPYKITTEDRMVRISISRDTPNC